MTLQASVALTLGDFTLDVELDAPAGSTVAILGPNGAGKSTLLRCIAGLTPVDRGRVVLDGRTLEDTATGVRVAPQERSIGMVFQQHLLFPSMDVAENVAFGLRARGVARAAARRRALDLLERVGLADRAGSRPGDLSGGQSQRVALARALAVDPAIVLLDEPLAALDATTRGEVRRELRAHLDGVDAVRLLVTHDPVDAFALADLVVVVEQGRVTQRGALADVAAAPTTPYLADLMGLNLMECVVGGGEIRLASGQRWPLAAGAGVSDGPAFAVVHPRDVRLVDPDDPARSDCQRLSGPIVAIDLERDRALVRLGGPTKLAAELDPAALLRAGLRVGEVVTVEIAADAIRLAHRTG